MTDQQIAVAWQVAEGLAQSLCVGLAAILFVYALVVALDRIDQTREQDR